MRGLQIVDNLHDGFHFSISVKLLVVEFVDHPVYVSWFDLGVGFPINHILSIVRISQSPTELNVSWKEIGSVVSSFLLLLDFFIDRANKLQLTFCLFSEILQQISAFLFVVSSESQIDFDSAEFLCEVQCLVDLFLVKIKVFWF